MDAEVDILLASYNGEQYLADQIHSIFRQSFPSLQVIVRDDGSADQSKEVLKQLSTHYPSLHVIHAKSNQGLRHNFSSLLEETRASYIMLCDQDDIWLPEKVALTLAKMTELERKKGKGTPLLVHTDLQVVNKHLQLIHPSFWKYAKLNPHRGLTLNRLLAQNTITGCTVMINRPLLELARPIPAEVVMHDWWLGLVAAAFGAIGFVDHATILYRQHGKNDTGAKKYGLLEGLKRLANPKERSKISKNYSQRFRQAEAFLKRYENQLSQEQKTLITSFLKLEKASPLKKCCLLLRHGLYKQGILRNLYEIFE